MAIIIGSIFSDVVVDTVFNDAIYTYEGNDYIYGGIGFDYINGGFGLDTVDYGFLGLGITLEAGGFVNKGIAGIDELFSVENIVGSAGYINTIDGSTDLSGTLALNVDLSLNSATFTSLLGLGSQSFLVQNFIDVIGTINDDIIIGDFQNNVLSGWGGDDYIFGGSGNDLIYGGSGNDTLDGGSGSDALYGGSGSDYIYGSFGSDFIDGGSGFDTVDYGFLSTGIVLDANGFINKGIEGIDSLVSVEKVIGSGNYVNTIDGSTELTGLVSLNANLSLNTVSFNSLLGWGSLEFTVQNFIDVIGTVNDDTILGDLQNNILSGWGGDDYIFGAGGNDVIYGGSGNDTLDGGSGSDSIYGGSGNDVLYGGSGHDYLSGGSGSDLLVGESGNDTLVGYGFGLAEYDTLSGGSGADLFVLGDASGVYYLGAGYATITDFNYLEGDKIQVAGSSSNYSLSFQNWSGGFALDTLIYFGSDLIGVVQDNTNVIPYFDFVSA
ncbi:MAG: calcium-binding protein [Spirulina sp.]